MILGWLFAPPAQRRLLGQSRMRGAMPWVIAIMSFSIMIVAATGLALATTAATLTRAIEARYSVEVPAGANLGSALRTVRAAPGVISTEAVPESDMRKTLERWLGPEAQSRDLPVPGLIHFGMRLNAPLGPVELRVGAAVPGARVLAHRESVGPLLRSLRLLQGIAFGLVMMLTGAASAAVVLAARSALDTHRSTIDVMHGVGATDLQVTHLFQRRIAIDALVGSVGGAIAAAIVLALIATVASFTAELTAGATLVAWDLAVLALLPLVLAALVTLVARSAVLTTLRKSL